MDFIFSLANVHMDFSRRNILSLQPRFCLGLSLWPLRAQDKAGSGLGQFQRWPLRANSDVATKGLSMWPLRAQDKAGRGLGQIQRWMRAQNKGGAACTHRKIAGHSSKSVGVCLFTGQEPHKRTKSTQAHKAGPYAHPCT